MARTRNALWLTILGALALLLVALSPLPVAGDVEARGGALLLPLSSALRDTVRPLAEVALHAGQLQELAAENVSLRQHLAALEAEASALREQRATTEQVRALQAAVGNAGGHLAAAVIVREPAPGRRGVTIDRGAADGVRAGQAVLGPGAILVGVVVETQDHRARVRLLDDPHSAVAAVVQQSRTAGALAGTADGLRLEFVTNGAAVAAGDLVLSSPIGGQLASGLLIGRVGSVRARTEDLFETVVVEPLTDYNRLEHVLVVTAFTPGDGDAVMSALVALLALGAALLQIGAMPAFAFDAATAPLVPIALLAAWGTVRDPAEVWPALLLVAIALGVASEQRAGWYLLALLPSAALLLTPAARTSLATLARAPLAAAAGTWAYLALLLVAAGDAAVIPALSVNLVIAALWTGALAALLALALWPLRGRRRGLFT